MATAAPLGGEESERGERAGRQAGWRMEGEEAATGVQGSWVPRGCEAYETAGRKVWIGGDGGGEGRVGGVRVGG